MPYRKYPLVTGETYHIFNRSIAHQPIFVTKSDHQRILELINYYRYLKPRLRFSHYHQLSLISRQKYLDELYSTRKPQIEISAFCIMPNHLHFLVREIISNGIRDFMRNLQNSYAKYYNTNNKRNGAVFQSMFKGIRIETDEQFLHVTRYIHLNPLTNYVLKEKEDLFTYFCSSFIDYMDKPRQFVSTNRLQEYFKSKGDFQKFTFDQADYQRKLNNLKHLLFE